MSTLICIPTYDEAANIARVVGAVRAAEPEADVLVIDDASPDGTGRIADGLAAEDPAVHVLHRAGKDGLGRAYLAGFEWALALGYDAVVEMDADGSHRALDLPALLAASERGADLVLGSRWIPGGRVRNWAWHRVLLSRAGNAYARAMLSLPYGDVTGGFRVFRTDALRRLDLAQVRSEGYCFQIDLVRRAHQRGLEVVEVPITFVERQHGASKMSRRIVLEALWSTTRWSLERLRPARAAAGGGARVRT
ncbi:polyprenol monophosphomannose synthase [Amnibacterium endophyticum]|uniref:Polyprenol monophosphomannose synthase n=1 Tax=Amnibacterium endophyticum TaxID=2109337 RepID=A0ABW4LBH1_9MICO